MVAESSKMGPETSEDLTTVMFRDDGFLSRCGLNEGNVMEYFAMSQFYDPRCNNHTIRMQHLPDSVLENMAGIQYSVSTATPDLYIVTKANRTLNPPSLEPICSYYVFGGNIYQSPTMHAILSSRMLQTLHYLRKAFDSVRGASAVSADGSYKWDPPPVPADDGEIRVAPDDVTSDERQAVNDVLYDILQKNKRIKDAHEERKAVQERQPATQPGPSTGAPAPGAPAQFGGKPEA